MEKTDYWRLCDEVTVVQAILLHIGIENPTVWENVLNMAEQDKPEGFSAAFTAFSHAIIGERLKATIHHYESNPGNYGNEMEIDWDQTTVLFKDLRDWLKSRGSTTGFFFPQEDPQENNAPDYLNTGHKNYAPKLAAAINSWQAVNSAPELLNGKTVKKALETWLRKNASQYNLAKGDGNPNEQGGVIQKSGNI